MERSRKFAMNRTILLLVSAAILVALGPPVIGFAGEAWAARGLALAQATPGSETDPLVSKSYVDQLALWRLVTLEAGQTLVAAQGTEIIVRAGQAQVVASPSGGLADVTAGRDLADRERIQANHLLIVPRSDGRGLRAVTQVILLVRGAFEIR